MFHSARIKLTFWYVIIAAVITGFFSVLIYNFVTAEFDHELNRERIRIERALSPRPGNPPRIIIRQPDPELVAQMHKRILFHILTVDAIIVAIVALAGYLLAGRTLRPIKRIMEEQDRFISDASHELRTPLTAARTEIEVGLRDKQLNLPEAKELLESSLEEIKSMQILSDNLLSLAQEDDMGASMQSLSLSEILTKANKQVKPLAKRKGSSISIPNTEHRIKGNAERLIELFVILFDNAIKYSPEGKTITVTEKRTDGHVVIKVTDSGIGIRASEMPHIFDRFYRAEKSRNKTNVSGYGLGLSIAKKIVEEYKGTIHVKSKEGEGTTFILKLPVGEKKTA